jgi:ribosomal protein S27AE
MSASDSERMTCPKCASHVAMVIKTRLYCAACGYRLILDEHADAQAQSEPVSGIEERGTPKPT